MDDQFLPGQVISGRFRLERLLGRGGMGTVWEARHLSLQTQIAIKFLNSDLSRRHDVLARFAREATSAARISSPHVVRILDSGFTDEGYGFIAMELLRGDDLGRRLARFGTLTVGETALLVTQVCRGLAKAHSAGVVHRDLKPENIFIVDEDDAFMVKILDFGIAKSIGTEAATHKTDTGQLLGTPLYMSPEQALGRSLDSRSDLYSLAVVAYRCLAGRPPFTYAAVGEVIVAVSTHEPPPPSKFNPDLSPAVDAWFTGALAKDPSERSGQTASELSDSFNRACGASLDMMHTVNLRNASARRSYPPLSIGGSTEPPAPSREEIATTIAAAQVPSASRSQSTRLTMTRRWWPALAAALLVGAATTAFRSREQRSLARPQKVIASANAARPASGVAVAITTPEVPASPREQSKDAARPAGLAHAVLTPRVQSAPIRNRALRTTRATVATKSSNGEAGAVDAGKASPDSAPPIVAEPQATVEKPPPKGPAIYRGDPWH